MNNDKHNLALGSPATQSRRCLTVLALSFASALFSFPSVSSNNVNSGTQYEGLTKISHQVGYQVENVERVKPAVKAIDLRQLPRLQSTWQIGQAIDVNPKVRLPIDPRLASMPLANPLPTQVDALMAAQRKISKGVKIQNVESGINLDGLGFSGVNPPDTVGDVGKDYFIQSTNASGGAVVAVYQKSDGSEVASFTMDSLGEGRCARGAGDPIILYDELAERWLLSEFSSSGNFLCVYISQSDDPIAGGWYNYAFQAPNFPDYPKYGVWPDAYFVGSNEGTPAVYAFDRLAMLAGQEATSQRFTGPRLQGFGFQMITPADLDGRTAPPLGAPNYFMRHNDDEAHNPGGNDASQDFLEIFEFRPDFQDPSSASFTGPIRIGIADIDSRLCGLTSFSCIDQPNSSVDLDPLREVVMFRLSYRNFGDYEVLLGNLATDVGGDQAGVRWFELRKSGTGDWQLYQEGTYAPDAVSRWMGGIAMDGDGNIALGYNVANNEVFAGLRYTGRLAGDPLGVMTEVESTLVDGLGANASNRFGDYLSMSVDPVDQCTFWFTGQYALANGRWQTRFGSFAFPSCLDDTPEEDDFVITGTNLDQEICESETTSDISLRLEPVADFSLPVNLTFSGLPDGVGSFSANDLVPPANLLASLDSEALAPGSYDFSINATAVGFEPKSLAGSLVINGKPSAFQLSAPANEAEEIELQPTFSWQASDSAATYLIEIDDDQDFSSIDISATLSNSTNFVPLTTLVPNTTYFWRVTAENACDTQVSSVFEFTTIDVPDEARLENGVTKRPLSATRNNELLFYIDVPPNAVSLEVQIQGGPGDADLYVRFGNEPTTSVYDCRSISNNNRERCTIDNPSAGRYFVKVRAYRTFSNLQLTASFALGTPPGEEVIIERTDLSGVNRGDIEVFTFDIPAGADDLEIALSGNNGDADLYINIGSEPTYGSRGEFVCRKVSNGSNERCEFNNPTPGVYFVAVRTWSAFNNASLRVRYELQ